MKACFLFESTTAKEKCTTLCLGLIPEGLCFFFSMQKPVPVKTISALSGHTALSLI